MQLELPGVYGGKEILAQPRVEQGKRADGENEEEDEEDGAVGDGQLQQAEIEGAQLFKSPLESELRANQRVAAPLFLLLGCRIMLLKQVLGHGWDHGARKEIRSQHGKDHGFFQRDKEILGHASHKEHGYKDDADG